MKQLVSEAIFEVVREASSNRLLFVSYGTQLYKGISIKNLSDPRVRYFAHSKFGLVSSDILPRKDHARRLFSEYHRRLWESEQKAFVMLCICVAAVVETT